MSNESPPPPEVQLRSGSSCSGESDASALLVEALIQLLPVHGLRSLLPELARCWRDATAADVVFVSVALEAGTGLRGAVVSDRRNPEPLAVFADVARGWSESAARTLLATSDHIEPGLPGNVPAEMASETGDAPGVEAIPFLLNQHCPGGVLLIRSDATRSSRSVNPRLWHRPAELSARLIAQAMLVDPDTARDIEHLIPDPEKLEAMAEFAAGAGHEINNPVATISGRVQMLLRGETDPERRHALINIGGQSLRIRDMIGDAMLFARPPLPQPVPVSLAESLEQTIDKLAEPLRAAGADVAVKLPPDLPSLHADPTQLSIVLSNLFLNSLEALTEPGVIEVSAECCRVGNREAIRFSIVDPGRGFTEIERRHLFDPFFSGRQAGRGLGFGLPKCWRIVSNHGGRIEVESTPGTTRVHVEWPTVECSGAE